MRVVIRFPSKAELMDFGVKVAGIALGDVVDKYLTARLEKYLGGFGRLATGVLVGLFGPMVMDQFNIGMPELKEAISLAGAAVAAEWLKAKLPGGSTSAFVAPKTSQTVYYPPVKRKSTFAVTW